jgi:outer membrane protein assembly factor BamB
VAVEVAAETDVNKIESTFILPAQPQEVTEGLEDFRRHAKRGTWEKAFKALTTMLTKANDGLIARKDGVLVPAPVLWRSLLAELPAEGKKAYRLFHDAQAKALLEQAQGKDETAKLEQIVNNHLITSVGDTAANRLGDLSFEQGLLDRAVESWQTILLYSPDSSIPRPELLTKIGIALARSGRYSELKQVQAELEQKHKTAVVTLGGKKVSPAEHLAKLAAAGGSLTPQSRPAPDVSLPEKDDAAPLWQFKLPGNIEPVQQQNWRFGWNWEDFGRMALAEMVLPVVVDETRVYSTILGCDMAIDLKTGKLLWRSARYSDMKEKMKQNPYIFPERYHITIDKDRVWSVARNPEQVGQHGAVFFLIARDKATGKELLHTKNVRDMQQWSILGKPLPAGDVVYATATKQGQGTQLNVLKINAKDGKLLWARQLGTAKTDPDQNYYQRATQPSLLLHEDKLFVETHSGALLQVNAADGKIGWAVIYRCNPPNNNYSSYGQRPYATAGPPQMVNGVLYSKSMHGDDLLAILPSGPRVLWRRWVGITAMLAAVDTNHVYMVGELEGDGTHTTKAFSLTIMEGKHVKSVWSHKVPPSTAWIRAAATSNRLYQFTSRGIIELDKSNGNRLRNGSAEAYKSVGHPFRGQDMEANGGTVEITPFGLITSSNMTITAYPIAAAPQQTAQAPAAP